ncbi:MAG: hypothetical protein HC913_02950 [Microscillaceae bacterium]|nr:hypothetical protein [Microscillaceae bacterium]
MKVSIRFIRFDAALQTVLMFFNTLFLLFSIFALINLYDSLAVLLLMYLQFFLGVYQLILSALPHLLLRKTLSPELYHFRQWHMGVSVLYVFIFILIDPFMGSWLGWAYIVFLPQSFAYFYYWLTVRDYYSRRDYLNGRATVFAY